MDQLPLEKFLKIVELGLLICQNSKCLFLSKVGENVWLWEIGGVFLISDQFLLEYISLCLNKWIWLRDRKLSLICKNKPSGGKEWSKYAKFELKQICVLICIDVTLLLVAFCCVGINHQKGGDWKGNVPLGHFYKILVIKCPTHIKGMSICQRGGQKCKSIQRYDSRLSTLVFVY
jgi:hypothetical protein